MNKKLCTQPDGCQNEDPRSCLNEGCKETPNEIQTIVCEEILSGVIGHFPGITIEQKQMIFAAMKKYAARKLGAAKHKIWETGGNVIIPTTIYLGMEKELREKGARLKEAVKHLIDSRREIKSLTLCERIDSFMSQNGIWQIEEEIGWKEAGTK